MNIITNISHVDALIESAFSPPAISDLSVFFLEIESVFADSRRLSRPLIRDKEKCYTELFSFAT